MVAELYHFFPHKPPTPAAATLGILAFDAANVMRRLVSFYNSLTDGEILRLCRDTLTSKGVSYLNSKQERFLLNLAFAELLEDLDNTAAAVSRLGQKCSDPTLTRFDLIDTGKLKFGSWRARRYVEKMEKFVTSTGDLRAAMECLAHVEASQKRIKGLNIATSLCKIDVQDLYRQMEYHRKQVTHYKQVSLWNQSFDKTVRLMGRVLSMIYDRICFVFRPYISDNLSPNVVDNNFNDSYCLLEHRELYQTNHHTRSNLVSKSSPIPIGSNSNNNNRVYRMAGESTVGGAGLTWRYANVILMAERWLHAPPEESEMGESERAEMYEMLPERVKGEVRKKMRRRRQWWKGEEREEGGDGRSPAEGWREAVEEIMEWLTPVARETVRWQEERSMGVVGMEKRTLLLQTLHYSDLDKTEAVIVQLLVGLSCIYRYQERRRLTRL